MNNNYIDKHILEFNETLSIETIIKIINYFIDNNYKISKCDIDYNVNNNGHHVHTIYLESYYEKIIMLDIYRISFKNFDKNEVFKEYDNVLKIIMEMGKE